ncbi:MAG: hypothetical protein AAF726_03235 [Planctomycetota bacterium]
MPLLFLPLALPVAAQEILPRPVWYEDDVTIDAVLGFDVRDVGTPFVGRNGQVLQPVFELRSTTQTLRTHWTVDGVVVLSDGQVIPGSPPGIALLGNLQPPASLLGDVHPLLSCSYFESAPGGLPRSAVVRDGRFLVRHGDPFAVPGFGAGSTYDSVQSPVGAVAGTFLVEASIVDSAGLRSGTKCVELEYDQQGDITATTVLFEEGAAFPSGGGVIQFIRVDDAARDGTYGVRLVDSGNRWAAVVGGATVLETGDVLPGVSSPVDSLHALAVRSGGSWAAVAFMQTGAFVLVRDGVVLRDYGVDPLPVSQPGDTTPFRTASFEMAETGRVVWSADFLTIDPGTGSSSLDRLVLSDGDLYASVESLAAYEADDVSYVEGAVDDDGAFLGLVYGLGASASRRSRSMVVPLDQGITTCAGAQSSLGASAGLEVLGTPERFANLPFATTGMQLVATRIPVGRTAVFLGGPASTALPGFGGAGGTLCVEPQSARSSEALVAEFDGTVRLSAGAFYAPTLFGAALPGETWHFQSWYRDADPMSGASRSLFSDASSVSFW